MNNATDEAIVFGERLNWPIPDWTLYRIEIRENASGDVRKFLVRGGWSDDSPAAWQRMCDCQVHGFYARTHFDASLNQWVPTSGNHEQFAHQMALTCNHNLPSTKYVVLAAYLGDGRVYDFSEEKYNVHAQESN